MKFTCSDLEAALRDERPESMAAAREHALECPACREELAAWDRLSSMARLLHREWESPSLWPRIEAAAAREKRTKWQAGWLAIAAALVIAVTGGLWWKMQPHQPAAQQDEQQFLSEQALAESARAEAAYAKSIEALAKLAAPQLEKADTPLMASYHDKIVLLDEAIAELRAQSEGNPFHVQMRRELLSLYREKQKTLEEVLDYAKDSHKKG